MSLRQKTTPRSRTLFGLSVRRGRLHRYSIYRWIVGIVFTAAVSALPFTGLMRLDVLGGENSVGGEVTPTLVAVRTFAFVFLGINIGIILASRFLGRWLCGFVCPVGSMNRFAEWVRWRTRKLKLRALGGLGIFAACFALANVAVAFFIAPGSLLAAPPRVQAAIAAVVFAIAGGLFAIVHFLGMRFCREFCPSGVYFAVLGPKSATGVEFAHPENCTDCGACTAVCPVYLEPKHILDDKPREGMGFYPDGLTNLANCLRCGDCVTVCESTVPEENTPLRMGLIQMAEEASESEEASA